MALASPGARNVDLTRKFPLTAEQEAIVHSAVNDTQPTVAEALAGTGKTSTCVEIAKAMPGRRGVYLAFNKSVALEAERRFPDWISVGTAHSFAYQAVGRQYGHRLPGNSDASRMGAQAMARILRVKPAMLDTGTLNPVVVTRMAQATVNAFMKTTNHQVEDIHVPARVVGMHSPDEIREIVVPIARRIWDDLDSLKGKFRYTHDVYLKQWHDRGAVLNGDLVIFDEAQDADPVTAAVVAAQYGKKIYVGDRNQAIYGWRGAIDAMSKIEGAARHPLTKSFRFGPAIAETANHFLAELGSKLRVVGHDPVRSEVRGLREGEYPRAILCRGNGTALGWVLAFHMNNVPVALAPGDRSAGKELEKFAWAAKDLMNGEGTDHPDLVGFQTWDELTKYVDEEEDTDDLKRLVGIVNRIGVSKVIDAVRGLVTEDKARVTVSTAHKAKGLEWSSVKVADDFVPRLDRDGNEEPPTPEDLMLNYVTVTRAKNLLDPGPLGQWL